MCGAAVPITCDNILRSNEVSSLTKNIDCVWGCYCAQGYVRSNSNGECILEDECRDYKSVEFVPQSSGMLKRLKPHQQPQQIHIHNHNEASTGSIFILGSSAGSSNLIDKIDSLDIGNFRLWIIWML